MMFNFRCLSCSHCNDANATKKEKEEEADKNHTEITIYCSFAFSQPVSSSVNVCICVCHTAHGFCLSIWTSRMLCARLVITQPTFSNTEKASSLISK